MYNGDQQIPELQNYDPTYLDAIDLLPTAGYQNSNTKIITHRNIGSYHTRFTPNSSSLWIDGTKTPVTISWSITMLKVKKPSVRYQDKDHDINIIFANKNIGPEIVNCDYKHVIVSTATGFDTGTYTTIFTLKDAGNTTWEDGTTDPISYSWTIIKKQVQIPVLVNASLIFNNQVQEVTLDNFSDAAFIKLHDATAIRAGTINYTMISLIDTKNTTWNDGTTESKEVSWYISELFVDPPIVGNTKLSYSGKKQKPDITGINLSWMRVTNNNEILRGNYTSYVTLVDPENTLWKDTGDNLTREISWTITKKVITLPSILSDTSFTYNGQTQRLVISGSDGETDFIIDETYNKDTFETSWIRISGISGKTPGTYTLTFSLKDPQNTSFEGTSAVSVTKSWTIAKIPVLIPQPYDYVYNGHEQQCEFIFFDSDIMTVENDKATLAGSYTAVFSLKEPTNYMWQIGSSDPVNVVWTIAPQLVNPAVTLLLNDVTWIFDNQEHNFFDGFYDPDPDLFTIVGQTVTKEVGVYDIKIYLRDHVNYNWSTSLKASDPIVYKFTIKKCPVELPTLIKDTFVYTGKNVTITKNSFVFATAQDKSFVTVESSGNIGVDADTYTAILSFGAFQNSCIWNDTKKSNNRTISWTITKAPLPLWYVSHYDITLPVEENSYRDIFVTREGNGEVIAVTDNDTVIKLRVFYSRDADAKVRVYSKGITGTALVTISVNSGRNYLSSADSESEDCASSLSCAVRIEG